VRFAKYVETYTLKTIKVPNLFCFRVIYYYGRNIPSRRHSSQDRSLNIRRFEKFKSHIFVVICYFRLGDIYFRFSVCVYKTFVGLLIM
jgi:hypothetical protein